MPNYIEWEVTLFISGPITIKEQLKLYVEKGHVNPFWTTVRLVKESSCPGVRVELVARANTQEEANDAAVYFVGQMLDVLCLQFNLPLYLSLLPPQRRSEDAYAKRVVEKHEWEDAFEKGRLYGAQHAPFSRALSWYRKGIVSRPHRQTTGSLVLNGDNGS